MRSIPDSLVRDLRMLPPETLSDRFRTPPLDDHPAILALASRVATLHGYHRDCRQSGCKRARRCAAAGAPC
jgi:hypothetical protein